MDELDRTPASTPADPRADALSLVLLTSLLGGLCPLSPIPFIDDLAVRFVQRYQARKLLASAGVTPTSEQLDALLRAPARSAWWTCCSMVLLYPLKKIFRKVFYFLAVKESADLTAELLHQGLLLRYALDRKHLSPRELAHGTEAAIRFNRAMHLTLQRTDSGALNAVLRRFFAGSRVLIQEAAASVGRLLGRVGFSRKRPEGEAPLDERALRDSPAVASLTQQLAAALEGDDGYAERLYAAFDAALREVDQGEQPALPQSSGPTP